MIIGIGIDTVEIARFTQWSIKSQTTLQRVFSDEEIAYCRHDHSKSAERFAVRFAAREAFYKALSSANSNKTPPFLSVARAIKILKLHTGKPYLVIDWHTLPHIDDAIALSTWHVSLTHTNTIATAVVIGENLLESAKLI
jgi:holo-[acyl-carrier protein] synthase